MLLDAELLQRDRVYFLFDFPLGSAGLDKPAPLDFIKQSLCSLFGIDKRCTAI